MLYFIVDPFSSRSFPLSRPTSLDIPTYARSLSIPRQDLEFLQRRQRWRNGAASSWQRRTPTTVAFDGDARMRSKRDWNPISRRVSLRGPVPRPSRRFPRRPAAADTASRLPRRNLFSLFAASSADCWHSWCWRTRCWWTRCWQRCRCSSCNWTRWTNCSPRSTNCSLRATRDP